MPTLEELDRQFEGRTAPAVDTDAGDVIAWGEGTPPEAPDAEAEGASPDPDPALPPEIHPVIARLWRETPPAPGQEYPSTRAIRAALKAAGVRIGSTSMHAQLQRLRAGDLATPQQTDAVSQAERALALAQQAVQAVETETMTTQAQVAQLDQAVATLIARASSGDGEAAQAIPETKEVLKLTLRTLEVQLPLAKAQVEAGAKAAEKALAEACTARDIEDWNRLAAAEEALDRAVMEAVDVLHERLVARLSHALAQRTIAGRLTIPLGEAHTAPERRLAAYVLGQLADVCPPYPQGVGRSPMPQVTDLVETSTTNRPLTAAEVQVLRGQGQVSVVYRGTRSVSLDGCEPQPNLPASQRLERQTRLQHHAPVQLSLHDFAVLHARYGEDLMIVPPPVWER